MSHDERIENLKETRQEEVNYDAPIRTTEQIYLNKMSGTDPSQIGRLERPRSSPISVAIDPVALITTECITVTSAMRKHTRWAHSSVSAILGGGGTSLDAIGMPGDDLSMRRSGRNNLSLLNDASLANRWGLRGKRGKSIQDNPLMAGFGRLRRDLAGCKGKGVSVKSHRITS